MDTLRKLADLIIRVSDKIDDLPNTVTTSKEWLRLHSELEKLENITPGHHLVVAARVRWYLHGLDSFERYFVKPSENTTDGSSKREGNILHFIAEYDQLFHFLRRRLLGNAFGKLYEDFEALLRRLVQASSERSTERNSWQERLLNLRQNLIHSGLE